MGWKKYFLNKKGEKDINLFEGTIHSDIPNYLIHKVFDPIDQNFKLAEIKSHKVIVSEDGLVSISSPGEILNDSDGLVHVNKSDLQVIDDTIGLGKSFVKRIYLTRIIDGLEPYQIYVNKEESSPILISHTDGNIYIEPVKNNDNNSFQSKIDDEIKESKENSDNSKYSADKLFKSVEKQSSKKVKHIKSPFKKDPSSKKLAPIKDEDWGTFKSMGNI